MMRNLSETTDVVGELLHPKLVFYSVPFYLKLEVAKVNSKILHETK